MKQRIVYICSVLFAVCYILIGSHIAHADIPSFQNIYQDSCEKARVEGIISRTTAQMSDGMFFSNGVNITFGATLLSGEGKGSLVTAIQNCDPEAAYQLREIKPGDTVLLVKGQGNGENWLMGEYVRTDNLIVFGAIFALLLVLFGKMKGFNALLSLCFTCLSIFAVFIPAILAGRNIYFWTMLTCTFIILMTLLLVNGADRKSLCGAAGCFCGVLAAGVLTFVFDGFLQLTGMIDEQSLFLKYMIEDRPIDLKAIIFAGILIGAVGAIMDVAISMSSALYELSLTEGSSTASLLKSGMAIGRDIMGTMSNTLVLAYIGSSLSTTLLLTAYSTSLLSLLNREMIVVEILQALVGSFGLLLTIPLTSVVCAVVYKKSQKQIEQYPYGDMLHKEGVKEEKQ